LLLGIFLLFEFFSPKCKKILVFARIIGQKRNFFYNSSARESKEALFNSSAADGDESSLGGALDPALPIEGVHCTVTTVNW
jgi:hypothetical protein